MTKSVLHGRKFNSRHHSFILDAEPLLRKLRDSDSVKKIFLGEINRVKPAKPHVKIKFVKGNLISFTVRSTTGIQNFKLVAINSEKAAKIITDHKSM